MYRTNEEPLVSVVVTTYNHSNYIKECLDGILEQKTSFPFEIIIGEDESSDGTREICIDYAKRFPESIRLFLRSREDVIFIEGTATGRYNFLESLKACKGTFVALIDGDDFWTDSLKLQKQVDFMTQNPNYGICFHNVKEKNTINGRNELIPGIQKDVDFSLDDFLLSNKTAMCSIVFKRSLFEGNIPEWLYYIPFADLSIILYVLKKTNEKGMVLKDVMGVYRIHKDSLHGALRKSKRGLLKAYRQHLKFTRIVKKELLNDSKYQRTFFLKKLNTLQKIEDLYKGEKRMTRFFYFKLQRVYYAVLLKYYI